MQNGIQQIINGCKRGDRKSQSLLFRQFARWGLTICRRYVREEGKAEEALNDGFIRIFKRIDTYDPAKGELKAWMSRIFVNCALTTTKRETFNTSFSSISDMNTDPVADEVFYDYNPEQLLSFLRNMPLGYRTVFNMAVVEEYSHKEIAKLLNVSEITSRSQLRKAKIWIHNNVCLSTLKSKLES